MSRKTKKPTTNPNPASCACGKSCYFSGAWTCQSWCAAQSETQKASVSPESARVFGIMFASATGK